MQDETDSGHHSTPNPPNSSSDPKASAWAQLETDTNGLATLNSMQLQLIQNMARTIEELKNHESPPT